jgi:hypothetical protein
MNMETQKPTSNCCDCHGSAVEVVDGLGICSACKEWAQFILIEEKDEMYE